MFTQPRTLEAALCQHFTQQKVLISFAISKPFPFFEGLRDSAFITEGQYRESQEAYQMQVPMSRVVYRILTTLEKTFSLLLLQNLFSPVNLHEYPNLRTILQSFVNVATSFGGWSRATPCFFEVPMVDGTSLQVRRLGPNLGRACHLPELLAGPPHPACSRVELPGILQRESLFPATPINDAGSQEVRKACPGTAQVPVTVISLIEVEEDVQEMPSAAPGPVPDDPPEPNDLEERQEAPELNDLEESQETPELNDLEVPQETPELNDLEEPQEAPELNDLEEPQEAPRTPPSTPRKAKKRKRSVWSTPKKRPHKKRPPKGAAAPGHGIQEQSQAGGQATPEMDNTPEIDNTPKMDDTAKMDDTPKMNDTLGDLKIMTRAQRARINCAGVPAPKEVSGHASKTNQGTGAQRPSGTPPRSRPESRRKLSWSSPSRRSQRRGAAAPGRGTQEPLQAAPKTDDPPKVDDSSRDLKVMTKNQRARTECAPVPAPKEIAGVECEIFHLPVLPITCGEIKGLLYKQKMKQGPSEKCIQNAQGRWFTPQEFEAEGQRGKSKRWRRSLRCRGQTLEHLLEKGLLFCPPRTSVIREGPEWKECEVCCKEEGDLLGCASCDRAFHKNCHIPAVGADRKPWSCTFCRMKEYSGNQQRPRESLAPARQMEPEVQLKCELLLLKAYCHPQGPFFAETPYNFHDYGKPFKEAMWLDLVKERLAEKDYTVSWFVRDMRLIFRNHQEFHKDSDLGDVGLDLETEFEKNLKEMLTLHGANENGFRVP